jgi:hypothetical protein
MDVKRVYSMSAEELRRAFRQASRERVSSPKYWDALMYRSSVLRSTFSLNDVSWITDALAVSPKYSSQLFLQHLVTPLPTNGETVMDSAMILRSVRKLSRDEQLVGKVETQVQSIIAKNITNSIAIKDLAIIARTLSTSSHIDPTLGQRMISIISNTKPETVLCETNVLSILKFLISAKSTSETFSYEEEPFFTQSSQQSPQTELIKAWLSRSIVLVNQFNPKDTLDFTLCVEKLVESMPSLGHPSSGPICSLISRAVVRNAKQFKIEQLVNLVQSRVEFDKTVVKNEIRYRVRELNYKNTLKLFLLNCDDLRETLLARLHRFDCLQVMTVNDLLRCGQVLDQSSSLTRSFLIACLGVARKAIPNEVPQVVDLYDRMGLKKELEHSVTRRNSLSTS